LIVDKPWMVPRRDYDDYTKFINDTYTDDKEQLLTEAAAMIPENSPPRRNGFFSPIRTYSDMPLEFS